METTEKLGSRNLIAAFALLLLGIMVYLPVVRGEFIFDDIDAIVINPFLREMHSLSQVFNFVLKPTRPISNLLLAVGAYLSPSTVTAQRVLSILLHCLTTVVLLLNLLRLSKRYREQIPFAACVAIAALFLISPIHAETVVVGQYRMDILGAFFTLFSAYIYQILLEGWAPTSPAEKKSMTAWRVLLFLSLGAATLSKEPYAFIAPATCILIATAFGLGRRAFLEIGLLQTFWGLILWSRLRIEKLFPFSFTELLGYENITPQSHLILSVHAFSEGLLKIATGQNLTIMRLQERIGDGASPYFPLMMGVLVFGSLGLLALLFSRGYWRIAGGIFLLGGFTYIVIPNRNIGSEHYWYLATAGFWMLVVPILWRNMSRAFGNPQRVFSLFVLLLLFAYVVNLEKRLVPMRTRIDFYLSELRLHPQYASRFIDLAAALIESPRAEHLPLARPLLDEARAIDPENTLLALNELQYAGRMKDREAAAVQYRKLRNIYAGYPGKFEPIQRYWKKVFGEEPATLSAGR